MSTILKPLSNGLYTIGKGVVHFYPLTDPNDPSSYSKGVRLGDMDALSVTVEVGSTTDRFSNEYSIKTLVKSIPAEITATVSVTLTQMSDFVRAAALMGSEGVFSQTSETESVKDLGATSAGVYWLGAYGVTNVSVDVGATAATIGTDYMLDPVSGQIEILTDYSGGVENVVVTYDAPEIVDRFITGIASNTGIRGRFVFRGVNADGPKSLMELNYVELRPAGGRDYISESDVQAIELTGSAYPVGTEEYPIGFEMSIE